MIATERTVERSNRARFEKDAHAQPRRSYSFDRAGHLWMPKSKRLELIGGGPCGAYAARGLGSGDKFWQPTSVATFALDVNPEFGVTTGLDGSRVTCATIVNNCPSTSDGFTNANTSLRPTYEPTGWGGSFARPSLLGNGSSYYLICTSTLAATLAGGTDTPYSLFWVAQQFSTTGTQNHLGFFRTSSALPIHDYFTSGGAYTSLRRDNAGTTPPVAPSGGTPDTNKHVFSAVYSGTDLTLKIDGATICNAASQDVGAITFDAMALFATYANASPNNWANLRMARVLGFTSALNTADESYVDSNLTAMYL